MSSVLAAKLMLEKNLRKWQQFSYVLLSRNISFSSTSSSAINKIDYNTYYLIYLKYFPAAKCPVNEIFYKCIKPSELRTCSSLISAKKPVPNEKCFRKCDCDGKFARNSSNMCIENADCFNLISAIDDDEGAPPAAPVPPVLLEWTSPVLAGVLPRNARIV